MKSPNYGGMKDFVATGHIILYTLVQKQCHLAMSGLGIGAFKFQTCNTCLFIK